MKITENMVIEKLDIEHMLLAYLRSYVFYNKGKQPIEITIPMLPEVTTPENKIPVRFVGYTPEEVVETEEALAQEEPIDNLDRPFRARGDSKPTKAKRTSQHYATEPES